MDLDYHEIGKRIARRRKQLGLKQSAVEEKADIGYKYLSSIERGISIPSIEVVMRLSLALDTTPDAFLVGTARPAGEEWRGGGRAAPGHDAQKAGAGPELPHLAVRPGAFIKKLRSQWLRSFFTVSAQAALSAATALVMS